MELLSPQTMPNNGYIAHLYLSMYRIAIGIWCWSLIYFLEQKNVYVSLSVSLATKKKEEK